MCRAKDQAVTFGLFDDDHKDALEDENTAEPGLSIAYSANILIDPLEHACICKVPLFPGSQYINNTSDLALNLKIGARIPNQQVIGQSNAQPRYIHDLIPSTGE
ncbi:hypothetical protein ASPVEDRAFT_23708 [Aspergillus versicolor CBS 583.65]|uniref:Uncharacterized protein n=1 Tax=Aspergillus versicolor CBS 583.65 TaxID=1036611 RepID=A0A1L9P5I7_ASPVE|nr:uncharacterized protein ASPVEDRAFT_23708 [Aspergillus versicolor CBS 583.65]OJI96714.1 hypothetical protein ASPVEDRAFT_23708 [Aspergillus versicolor CBS 583.65]